MINLWEQKLGTERQGTFWYLVLPKHFGRCHKRTEVRYPALLLPHILMDLDHYTLGSVGLLLSSVLLSPFICISVKCNGYSQWCFLFLLLIILCGIPSSQSPWGADEIMWLRHRLAMPWSAQSSPSIHTLDIYNCKLWFCYSFLFCTFDIYCMSVCLGKVIPLLWLFLGFLFLSPF